MDHINNGPYQLLKKDPTTKIKAKTLKQSMASKDNEFIDNKLYHYVKPIDSPAPRFYGQPKMHIPGAPIPVIVSCRGSQLYNFNKYIANILKAFVKNENCIQMNTKGLSGIAFGKRIKLRSTVGKQITTLAGIKRKLLIGKLG